MSVLLIRCDASPRMGTGHIMRCIALAQVWRDRGGQVKFISACESNTLKKRIIQEGFKLVEIEKQYPHSSDIALTLSELGDYQRHKTKINVENDYNDTLSMDQEPSWLILDGYHFTPEYHKAIRDAGIHLLVIDDMNHLPYYHADILLNQNIHAPDLKYQCDAGTILFIGTRYVLLRREFKKWQSWQREIPTVARKVLVTMGGSDPDNVTLKVINAIKHMDYSSLEIKVIAGPSNPNSEQLHEAVSSSSGTWHILKNVSNMPELMAWADVAVSAGGSTCWEMAFMGLPSLIITVADNQAGIAKGLGNAGAGIDLGWFDDLSENLLSNYIKQISEDSIIRKKCVEKGMELLDGFGAERVIDTMRKN